MVSTINFYLGQESVVIREKYQKRAESIFQEQYNKALGEIETFVRKTRNREKDKGLQFDWAVQPINNVFAFIGDRGTGKTSCMLSVSDMLDPYFAEKGMDVKFQLTTLVDPSFFDARTNILDLIIGHLFVQFTKRLESQSKPLPSEYLDKKMQLMTSFQETRNCIATIDNSPVREEDSLTKLKDLSANVSLRERIHTLVERYLEFMQADYLVIPVDDIDLHTAHAVEMTEQIRKYFIQDNVILLMALKMEQLNRVMELHYTKLYSDLMSANRISSADIMDMVTKYMVKLIPMNHRFYLPDVSVMTDAELKIWESENAKEPMHSGSSVKYTVTSLIFAKTRFLFYHSKGITSPIVPQNLRELWHLVALLCRMSDFRSTRDEYNKILFQEYFYDTWTANNMDAHGQAVADEIRNFRDAASFNKHTLKLLDEHFGFLKMIDGHVVNKDDQNENLKELQLILRDSNNAYNISIGDVVAVVNYLKLTVNRTEDRMLLFFVETVYSMKMYAYYDEMTEVTSSKVDNNRIDETIRVRELVEGWNNYFVFAAGLFINPQISPLLPNRIVRQGSDKSYPRTVRRIDTKPLKNILENLSSVTDTTKRKLYIQIAEFFALTASRRQNGKRKDIMLGYRSLSDVYYATDLSQVQYAVFDLSSFFFNVVALEKAYRRMFPGLYDIAKEEPNSLLKQFVNATNDKYHEPEDDTRWLSWTCIRNFEILEDFTSYIKHNTNSSSQVKDDLELFRRFFTKVGKYSIKTYDKTGNQEPYAIEFSYAQYISAMFQEISKDSEMVTLFNSVYSCELSRGVESEEDETVMETEQEEIPQVQEETHPQWDNFKRVVLAHVNVMKREKIKQRIETFAPDTASNPIFEETLCEVFTDANIAYRRESLESGLRVLFNRIHETEVNG